jgi:hypothetical protein
MRGILYECKMKAEDGRSGRATSYCSVADKQNEDLLKLTQKD